MKIELFRACTGEAIKAANKFMQGKTIVDVKITTSYITTEWGGTGIPTRSAVYDTIMVMYED